jgi:hypothetical protein
MSNFTTSACTAVLFLASVLMCASPAEAQKTTVPQVMLAEKPETAWWMTQLRQARQFGATALAGLEATPADDSIPVDEKVLQAARDTYVLLRSARGGIEIARNDRRYSGPMTDLVFKRVDEAWNLARAPVDRISWGNSRTEYLEVSIHNLRRSLQLVDQVFVLMP